MIEEKVRKFLLKCDKLQDYSKNNRLIINQLKSHKLLSVTNGF